MKPHKWSREIKAWADGAQIQFRYKDDWCDLEGDAPMWYVEYEYRIKPEPKPDVVLNVSVGQALGALVRKHNEPDNLRLVFDESGKLKSAEVINEN